MDHTLAFIRQAQRKNPIEEAVSTEYMPSYEWTKKLRKIVKGSSAKLLDILNIPKAMKKAIKEYNEVNKEHERLLELSANNREEAELQLKLIAGK